MFISFNKSFCKLILVKKVVLKKLFFIFTNTNIFFVNKKLIYMIYIIKKILSATKQIQLSNQIFLIKQN